MPITAFNSFTDGLDPIEGAANTSLPTPTWKMTASSLCRWCLVPALLLQRHVWRIQRSSERSPGAMLGTHYHVGTVHGYTMRHWRYLEYDWVPGTFIYEPAGEAHTLVITEDSPEPAIILFIVEGGLIYLNKSVDGGFLPTRMVSPHLS